MRADKRTKEALCAFRLVFKSGLGIEDGEGYFGSMGKLEGAIPRVSLEQWVWEAASWSIGRV